MHVSFEPFSPLKVRNYRLWFFGQMFSLVGSWMQIIAQNWLIYTLTNSPRTLGILNLFTFFIFFPLSLLGGSLADRYPKRNLIMLTQTIMIFPPLIISFLVWKGYIKVWQIIFLAVISEALQGLTMPIIQSFIVELTGKTELPRAVALNSMMFNIARMVGPSVAGFIIAKYNTALAFLFNGISFVFVLVALALMKLARTEPKTSDLVRHLKEGISYAITNKVIIIVFSLLFVSSTFALSTTTIIPVFAKDVFKQDAKAYGFLMSMLSFGAVLGGIVTAALSTRVRRTRLLFIGGLTYSFALILFSSVNLFYLAAVFFSLSGFFYVMQFSTMNTIVQLTTPDDRRGRVLSLYTMIFNSSMRFGGFIAGFLANELGGPLTVKIMAFVNLVYLLFSFQFAKYIRGS